MALTQQEQDALRDQARAMTRTEAEAQRVYEMAMAGRPPMMTEAQKTLRTAAGILRHGLKGYVVKRRQRR